MRKIFTVIVFLAIYCMADMDSSDLTAFYIQHESRYREEYLFCTSDSTEKDIKKILKWRQRMNEIAATPAYRLLLQSYISETGISKDIRPCIVINWHKQRMEELSKKDDTSMINQRTVDYAMVDSVIIAENIDNNPASKFDFGRIPFGVTKSAFSKIWSLEYRLPLTDMGNYYFVESWLVGDKKMLAAFYFSKQGRFNRYELQGMDHDRDSLNQLLRPESDFLVADFSKRFGEPDHQPRVAQFDVKPGKLSPVARWYQKPYVAFVGFSAEKFRYYSKVVVIREDL